MPIPLTDTYLLARWLDTEPEVPESNWFRSFPGFTVCGGGAFILEKAVGTAEYAKHAKAERVGEEDRFTQRVNDLVSLTPFPLAYLAYFAV